MPDCRAIRVHPAAKHLEGQERKKRWVGTSGRRPDCRFFSRFAVFDRASCAAPAGRKVLYMVAKAHAFDVGDYVVYPKHGVGRVIELQEQEIAGMTLELYVLRFEKERMTLRVPTNKVEAIGMRKLSSDKTLREALDTLKGKPKVKRTMWSRRAQEYEAKINSGDLVSIAEVTRDLFRADDQPEQSYSERQIFEAASSRLARELAAMEKTDEPAALKKILAILNEHAPKYYEVAAV
jgi:CarD family transcriptional regulator